MSLSGRSKPQMHCPVLLVMHRNRCCASEAAAEFTFSLSSKVEGSMLGKTFKATGSKTSMKGTTRKIMKGTSLNTSAVVRVSCFRSRLQAQTQDVRFHSLLPCTKCCGKGSILACSGYCGIKSIVQ